MELVLFVILNSLYFLGTKWWLLREPTNANKRFKAMLNFGGSSVSHRHLLGLHIIASAKVRDTLSRKMLFYLPQHVLANLYSRIFAIPFLSIWAVDEEPSSPFPEFILLLSSSLYSWFSGNESGGLRASSISFSVDMFIATNETS